MQDRGARRTFHAVVGLGIVLGAALLGLAALDPDEVDPRSWAVGEALVVVGVAVSEEDKPHSVMLEWPAPQGAVDGFQVLRDGQVIATLGSAARTFSDGAPDGVATRTYAVRAVSGGTPGPTLGSPQVRFPSVALGCTRLWTGAASSAWHDERNWADYGPIGGEDGFTVAAPGPDDHACADVTSRFPITVSEPDAVANRFTASPFRPATLRVASGALDLLDTSVIPALEMAGGTLALKGDTHLLWASGRPELSLGGGTLQIGTSLRIASSVGGPIRGDVVTVPGTTTTLDGGLLETQSLSFDQAAATVVGAGGHRTVATAVADLDDTTLQRGTGGATLETTSLTFVGGTNSIGWTVDAPDGQASFIQSQGGRALLADLAGLGPGDTELEGATVDLAGDLELVENLTSVAALQIDGDAAGLRSGGRPTDFAGLREIGALTVLGPAQVAFDGDLAVDELRLYDGAELDVAGTILDGAGDGQFTTIDESSVTVAKPWTIPVDGTLELRQGAEIRGDVIVGGVLFAGQVPDLPDWADAVFHDDLTLLDTASFVVGPASNLVVEGTLTIDGELIVEVPEALPDPTDRRVVQTASPPVGGFDLVTVTGDGADSASAEVRDDGVHIVSGESPPPTCEVVPDVRGMAVGGCWVADGPGRYVSSDDLIAKPDDAPTIGGFDFLPGAGVDLELDVTDPRAPTLAGVESDGGIGAVEVSTTVGGTEEWVVADRLDWVLDGTANPAAPDGLLGLEVAGAPTVVADGSGWVVDVDGKLPGLFGGASVPFSLEVGVGGVSQFVSDSTSLVFAEVAAVADVVVEYEGDALWTLSNGIAALIGVEGTLDYSTGDLGNASVTVTDLSVGGLGSLDATFVYDDKGLAWDADLDGPAGNLAARIVETASGTVAAGSSVGLRAVDLGVVALDDTFRVTKQAGGWVFEGSARAGDRIVQIQSTVLDFAGGALRAGELAVDGSVGDLATLGDFTMQVAPDLRLPGAEPAWRAWELSTTVVTGQGSRVVTGTLALADGALVHLSLPVDVTIGQLGSLAGVLGFDPTTARFGLEGTGGPGSKPVLSCGGAPHPALVGLELTGGRAVGGGLLLDELCLGPLTLGPVALTPGADGWDLVADLGGREVEGVVDLVDGAIDKASLDLPAFDLGGFLQLPAMELVHTDDGGRDVFSLGVPPEATDLVRRVEIVIDDGELVGGGIGLGEPGVGSPDLAPRVGETGGWLPIGGIDLVYNGARSAWDASGFLETPRVGFDGSLALADGEMVSGFLQLHGVDLGSLAQLDLLLEVEGGQRFSVDATLLGPAFDGARTASGWFEYADDGTAAGELTIGRFPVGDLAEISDLRMAFSTATGHWALDGSVTTGQGTTTAAGSLTFADGVLTAATLDLEQLPIGPSVVDLLRFRLDRKPSDPARISTYEVLGVVRGPRETGPTASGDAQLEAITGSATIADGQLTGFSATIPHLELPGVAYLEDLAVAYREHAGVTSLNGGGTLRTADDTPGTAASLTTELTDGRFTRVDITANRLGLGGVVVVEDFAARYRANGPNTCGDVTGGAGADVYTLTGALADGGGAIDACAAFSGRRLVAAELGLDQITVGELFTIESLQASVSQTTTEVVPLRAPGGALVPGGAELSRTALAVDATIRTGEQAPVVVEGSMELTDGGLSAFELRIPDLPLSATVGFEDLAVSYQQPSRWDGTGDTTFSVSGTARHDGGTTAAAGAFEFAATGGLQAASLEVTDLPLGPVTLDELAFVYDATGDSTEWGIDVVVTPPGGQPTAGRGGAIVADGRLVSATLDIPRFSVGELVLLSDAQFSFSREPDGSERWFATTSVIGQGQATDPASATIDITIGVDGRLVSGKVSVEHVRWGGLLTLTQLDLTGQRLSETSFEWTLAARLQVGDGSTTAVTGRLVLADGVVEEGELVLEGVEIENLVTIDRLELSADRDGAATVWEAALQVTPAEGVPTTGSGSLRWVGGRLDAANLEIGDLQIGELFDLHSLTVDYEAGVRWAAAAEIVDEDGTSTLAGDLRFDDGRWVGGSLDLASVQLGPVELSQLSLAVDATGTETGTVCGVADTPGPGTRFTLDATVATGDGDTTTVGGRMRLTDGVFTEGVLCGDGIQVAELAVLDDVLLAYSLTTVPGEGRTVSFAGTATVSDPDDPGSPAAAAFSFSVRDRQLQRVSLTADGIVLGDLLTLADVELGYDRADGGTDWTVAATVVRPGDDSTLEGSLSVVDGVIVEGSLSVAEIRFGDLFTLTSLDIDYVGRRAQTDPSTLPPFVGAGATSDCDAVPDDSNVPSGPFSDAGGESWFAVSAIADANGDTFAASGSLSVADGKLTTLDVSVACLPLGDFKTLEGARIALRPELLLMGARLQDEEGTSGAGGTLVFDDGRLVGGTLQVRNLPLGIVRIDTLDIALGENVNGDTTFGLTVVVENEDGDDFGGGGSLTFRDGRVVAGSLSIAELPFLDLFTIEDFSISVDGSDPDVFRFAGGAQVVLGDGGSAGMAISMGFADGRLVAGSFEASQVNLFEVVPLGGFSISFDSTARRWSGSMEATIPGVGQGSGPGIQLGVEFERGKLISGVFGFDADGDGEVDGLNSDGSAPASGGGDFTGLPLKALYIRYCAPDSTAAFCDPIDADTWEGRIGFELPTDGAPGLDASVRLRNGRFEAASLEISGLSIPVYPGVFLNALRAAIEINPRLLFAGGVGLTVGLPSGAFDIAAVDADLQFSEEPAPGPGDDPDTYEPEYLRFYTEGNASFLELPVDLFTFVDVQTRGFVGVGGGIDFDLIGGVLYVKGDAAGYVFDAGALGLKNPRTGADLTGPSAQVTGSTAAGILGVDLVSADFVANTIGAAACGQLKPLPKVGAGLYWSDGETEFTCDMGRFEIAGVESEPGVFSGAGLGTTATADEEEYEFSEFTVPAGEEALGVEVEGLGGVADVYLVDPDGNVYDADDDDPADGTLVATTTGNVRKAEGKRWFLIHEPTPGTWRVQAREPAAAETTVAIGEVAVSYTLPDVDVAGTLTPAGGSFHLDWTVAEIPGQEVVFIERSVDEADGFTAALGTATGASGRLTFTPGGSETGGRREVVAQVLQRGLLREEVVIAAFDVPDAVLASAPTDVSATEVVGGAVVRWQPPASNGGRVITSYRISSTTGWSVTAEADEHAAYLPIPGLVPGEVVPVQVQARTGLGWGEPATATFSAGQTTGLVYGQDERPSSSLPAVVPDAPTGATAVAGTGDRAGEATVSWTAPVFDGGSPVTGYTVTAAPGGQSCATTGDATCTVTGLAPGTVHTFVVRATNAVGTGPASEPATVVTPLPAGDRYTPVTPVRVLDSRKGTGLSGRWGAGESRSLVVAGVGEVPEGASAVVVNVTATGGSAATDLRVWASGVPVPGVSNLNVVAGETQANLVVAEVGSDGAIQIRNQSGEVHVIADVVGYFAPSVGDGYSSVGPVRVLDSRKGTGLSGRWGAGESRSLVVAGVGEVPEGASAVVVNVTATGGSAATDLRVWASGVPVPGVSNVNVVAGETQANLVVAEVGSDGAIQIRNQSGEVHVIADVVGYFAPSVGDGYSSVGPVRVLDSRKGTGLSGRWGAGESRSLVVAGVGEVPEGASAVVVNVTATGGSAATDLRVWASGVPVPGVSNLNVVAGETQANLVVAEVGSDGAIQIRNQSGEVHVIADVVGYLE